jgi:hypothetical protein
LFLAQQYLLFKLVEVPADVREAVRKVPVQAAIARKTTAHFVENTLSVKTLISVLKQIAQEVYVNQFPAHLPPPV